jgi:hypothetical protein
MLITALLGDDGFDENSEPGGVATPLCLDEVDDEIRTSHHASVAAAGESLEALSDKAERNTLASRREPSIEAPAPSVIHHQRPLAALEEPPPSKIVCALSIRCLEFRDIDATL